MLLAAELRELAGKEKSRLQQCYRITNCVNLNSD
jgi:hypothetical protein